MANNTKRLRTLQRQHRVAVIARRNGLAELAEATASETQSANLAQRSCELAGSRSYAAALIPGAELTRLSVFAGALAQIASEARRSQVVAQQHRDTAAARLAASDQRLERLDEHMAAAKREADRKMQLRETTDQAAVPVVLARKLLRKSSDT